MREFGHFSALTAALATGTAFAPNMLFKLAEEQDEGFNPGGRSPLSS